MRDAQIKVEAFMKRHGNRLHLSVEEAREYALLRARLVAEEAAELVAAIHDEDRGKIADAVGDLLYVTLGTASVYDVPAQEVFDEVHRSNMSKTELVNGKGGKGFGYFPPDLGAILRAYDEDLELGGRCGCGGLQLVEDPSAPPVCNVCG